MQKRLGQIALLMFSFGLLVSGGNGRFAGEAGSGEGTKSLESYWAETDLNELDIVNLLADKSCHANERSFLSCVNSVSAMAERLKLKVDTAGQVSPLGPDDMEKRLTERADLEVWTKVYQDGSYAKNLSFLNIWHTLRSHMKESQKLNSLIATGVNSFLSVSKDPHTYILPLAYYEEVLSRSEGSAPQMGFVARRIRGGAIVRKVFSDSAAEKAGLKKGDRILELNGEKVSQLHSAEFAELIRGQIGGRLRLKISRLPEPGLDPIEKVVEVLPGITAMTSVESRVIMQGGARLGLLTINKFARETCTMARQQTTELMGQSISGLLLDLRDNPGGQVDEAACVAGLFLPKNVIVFQTKYLDPVKFGETYWSEGPQLYTGPMAVLINGGSASAAEIVAGALKDLNRAVLVGERSFGKGSFQDGMVWRSQSKIALFQTQGFYYFPSGWTPQIVGLEPDIPARIGEIDTLREEDLYLLPLRPMDLWDGPQSLAWLFQSQCLQPSSAHSGVGGVGVYDEDIQVKTAMDWIRCGDGMAKSASQGI